MGDDNKSKKFEWRGPNLNAVSYGRPFPKDISITVPNKKKEEAVMGGEIKQKPIEAGDTKEIKEENVFTPNEVIEMANEHIIENARMERNAESKPPVIGPQFESIENPLKKLERHPNIDRVTVMQSGGSNAKAIAGTPQELEDMGVTKSVIGKKAVRGVVEPGKDEKTQKFLEPNR